MYQGIIQSTTIPVLEQVIQFSQARHNVLAGTIANLDTPGYRVRDLSQEDFQVRLQEAIHQRRAAPGRGSMGSLGPVGQMGVRNTPLAQVAKDAETILYHDDSNVGIEHQVTEMVKNQIQHNLALTIMGSQMQLLQVAISERV